MKFKVKEIREKMGYSQEALSKKAGVSRQIIYNLENNKEAVTSTTTLIKIAEALDSKVSDIFCE